MNRHRNQHKATGRQVKLEAAIMDLADLGYRPPAIAEILHEKPETVKRIHGYMAEGTVERTTRRAAEAGSAALLKAIRATGRTFA